MTLNELRPGERGTIKGFTRDAPPVRLLEMGMLPGTVVEVLRLAPLGDPMDLRLQGYRLSIRLEEAELILVDHTP